MRNSLRTIIVVIALAIPSLAALADAPAGYYSGINGLKEGELKTALSKIISKFTISGEYATVYNNLPDAFRRTDIRPGTYQWWDMYSSIPLSANSFWGLNREHSFPKSWWGGAQNIPAYVDLNHLYPSEAKANTAKSNYPLGVVDPAFSPKFDNGVTKVGYPKSGQGGGAAQVFEPDDEYKGDFARTYFYMVTAYQNLTWKYTYMVNQNLYPTLNSWSVDLLLDWARRDPVSQKEIDRNEQVYKIQNNRNPFIDFPDLFEYIWGNKKGQPFTGSSAPSIPTGDPVLFSPVQDMDLDFGQVALGQSVTAKLYFHGEYLSAPLDIILSRGDRAMFSLSSNTISATLVNSADGYYFNVTYAPTSLGEHTTRLVVSEGGLDGSLGVQLRGECLPVPSLSKIVATEATNVTDDSYVANWDIPADDVIDYYVVCRTKFIGGSSTVEELLAEGNELEITGFSESDSEAYTVQSVRLGIKSEPSNVVFVDHSGIAAVAADREPLIIRSIPGGFLVGCAQPQTQCCVYDVAGRLVTLIPVVENGDEVMLPMGVYFIVTAEHPTPVKTLVSY